MGIINIQYIFTFPDNNQIFIQLRLDDEDLLLLNYIPDELPYWTSLDFHQCPNCTLDVQEYPHCPSAVHYVKLLPIFHNIMSYEEVDVKVITAERMTLQKIRAQKAVSSVMGLINATSGCPHTAFFRPMARFHLPFSNAFETTYRATSMYTLAQYFLLKQGQDIDLEFQGLKKIYSNIQMIDEALIDRLRFASEKDVAVNALTNLDALAKLVQLSLEESLEEISHLFKQYIDRNIDSIRTSKRRETITGTATLEFEDEGKIRTMQAILGSISSAGVGLFVNNPVETKKQVSISIHFKSIGGGIKNNVIEGSVKYNKNLGSSHFVGIHFNEALNSEKQPLLYKHIQNILTFDG